MTSTLDDAARTLDATELAAVRADFPLLARTLRGGRPLVYLDSGATSQKPEVVLDAEQDFYAQRNAAVHRGAHQLAEEATEAFEDARDRVASFVGVSPGSLVWTSNATAGINLVAYAMSNASLGRGGAAARQFALGPGDEIVVTEAEHHANLVPWQELALRTGATLRWLGVDDDGRIRVDELDTVVTDRTKVLAFTHASNVTGAITPVAAFVARGPRSGCSDGAGRLPVGPAPAGGPDGPRRRLRGVLGAQDARPHGRRRAVRAARAARGHAAGDHRRVDGRGRHHGVDDVRAAAAAVRGRHADGRRRPSGWAPRRRTCTSWAWTRSPRTRRTWPGCCSTRSRRCPGVRVIGPTDTRDRLATVSFVVDGVHAHDVGQVLDDAGVAVRVGHHCAQPLHRRFGVASTTRASAAVYTTDEEIEVFREALTGVRAFFGLEVS